MTFRQYEAEFKAKIHEIENNGFEGVHKIWEYFKGSILLALTNEHTENYGEAISFGFEKTKAYYNEIIPASERYAVFFGRKIDWIGSHYPITLEIECYLYYSENPKMNHYFKIHNDSSLNFAIFRDLYDDTQLYNNRKLQFINDLESQKEFWDTIGGLDISKVDFSFGVD